MGEHKTAQEFLEEQVQIRRDFIAKYSKPAPSLSEKFLEFEKLTETLLKARKTKNYNALSKLIDLPKISEKENSCPNAEPITQNRTRTRQVKAEKLSTEKSTSSGISNEEMPAPVLPAPKKKQIKKEKQSVATKNLTLETRTVTRSKTSVLNRDSDVILNPLSISTIDLLDSEEEEPDSLVRCTRTRTKKKPQNPNTVAETSRTTRNKTEQLSAIKVKKEPEENQRTTRTKKKEAPKRNRSNSSTISTNKRSRSDSGKVKEQVVNSSIQTEYEDAISFVENVNQQTFTIPADKGESKKKIMDTTMIIEKSSKEPPQIIRNVDELLTDDESIEEIRKGTAQNIEDTHSNAVSDGKPLKKNNHKEVFSPYDKSPVKKRVEAFENFKNEIPTASKGNTSRILKVMEEKKGNVREMAKTFTPISSKNLYSKGGSSSSQISRYIKSSKTATPNSSMSSKNTTPLQSLRTRTLQTDFREKELKRQERERELKKREQLKASILEEKKKKNEEKLLKIQQQKEVEEKEKAKQRELQRMKEERVKLLLLQKEEKQRQLKEENERKRILAKQRAEEMKYKPAEEQTKKPAVDSLHKKILEKSISTPIYMVEPTPLLSCDDCYDSDEESYKSTRRIPSWCTKENLVIKDRKQTALKYKIKNTLYCCQSQSINLQEVFQKIDPRKLKRTSSAYWHKPPRFTMLTSVNED